MGDARTRRGVAVLLLLAGPTLCLVAMDRAIVGCSDHWAWAAREVPVGVVDPYRVEAVLRSTEPGPQNVFVLGDSTARHGIDIAVIAEPFADRGLRFQNLSSNNAAASTWGMAADSLLDLEPSALILMVGTTSFQGDPPDDRTLIYELRAVPEIYSLEDVLAAPRFHLDGAIGDLHVLARHRRALQNALLVRLGRRTWRDVGLDGAEPPEEKERRFEEQMQLVRTARGFEKLVRQPDTYPNPHTQGFERLARLAAQRGARLVVVETPQNPLVHPPTSAYLRREAQTRAFLEATSEKHGFALVTSHGSPRFTGRDFRDTTHMNERGRRRFSEYLREKLRALL